MAYFDKYGVVSLQDATHLDQHFDKAIAELLGELEAKVQLRIPFDRELLHARCCVQAEKVGLLLDITPQWLRLLSMAHTSLRDHPSGMLISISRMPDLAEKHRCQTRWDMLVEGVGGPEFRTPGHRSRMRGQEA